MTQELTLDLQRAATSTFEQLGFLLPDKDLSEEQAQAPVTGSSRIRFRGPLSGALEIEVAGNFLADMASNMLGDVDNPSQEDMMDALGEIANVICGNVLPALGGPDAVFNLSAPETSADPLPAHSASQVKEASAVMGLDEGRAVITIRLYG